MRSRVTGPFSATVNFSGGAVNSIESGPAGSVLTVQQTEFHSAVSTTINNSSGAFVAFGDGLALVAAISKMQLTSTMSEPLAFRVAASAAAAAGLSADTFVLNQGDGPVLINVSIALAAKIWVRSKSGNAVSAGYLTANLMG